MELKSKLSSGQIRRLGAGERRSALLNACIEQMRESHRRSAGTPRPSSFAPPARGGETGTTVSGAPAVPSRVRRVVTLLPASRVTDAALG
jgi:hypothetical protein